MHSRRRRLAPVIAVAVVTAATLGLALRADARPQSGPLLIRAGTARPPGRFVRGPDLYDAKGGHAALGAAVSGALMGPLAPVAVAGPKEAVAYSTWEPARPVDPRLSFSKQGIGDGDALGTPSVRVRDDQGRDALVARGAYSAAWRSDGALADFEAVADPRFRANRPYAGDVVVRTGPRGRAVTWSAEPGRYVVYAWAGRRLLFYRVGEGEALELLVADGPGDVRPLAPGSAIALSPDGRRIAIASPDATNVRVLDVASGREQAWLDVTTASPALRWVGYSGSWAGDDVVAPASAGIAVFHVGSESIELEQVLSVDQAQFPVGIQEPHFAGDGANEIVATADVPPRGGLGGSSFFLDCDRFARTCDRSAPAEATEWPRLVVNPSRPGGEG